MEPAEIRARLRSNRVPHERIALAIGRTRTAATNLVNGNRAIKAHEITPLLRLLEEYGTETVGHDDYLPVDLLPTTAGMGGPGLIDGEVSELPTVLVSRELIEDRLRGRPRDFLLIEVRGDSMWPDFSDGDQILCDKRDCNPVQPGPFALWDGDGYVVKNVERVAEGLRIFSTNSKYRERTASGEEISIIGRPVWFARSLR